MNRIGVVGAGLMGSEIALVFALSGRDVLLTDRSEADLERGVQAVERVLARGLQRGTYTAEDCARVRQGLRPVADLAAFADRDLVIEAVFEEESVKAEVFKRLDVVCPAGCVLASNTSTLSITGLGGYLARERRARFLGMHFFSPVSRMKLVELIAGIDTDARVVDAVVALCEAADKTPIRVKDVVGFAVNRMLHALMIEAVRLVEEGVVTAAEADLACRLGLGHPIGPFALSDAVTNRLCLQAQEILHGAYGERFRPRPLLRQMVQAGYDGKRAGRGWYPYGESK